MLAVALFLSAAFLAGRAETLPLTPYTMADGLAHDRVDRIVRDSIGFLWFCTAEGLSRFDGIEFKNYTQDDGLPHRSIRDLLETRSGQIWVATGGGLVIFDPNGASARKGASSDGSAAMFRPVRVEARTTDRPLWVEDLIEDRSGTVWAATNEGVYTLVMEDDWILRRFEIRAAVDNNNTIFHRILEDHTGAIWAGSEAGLYRISADRGSVATIHPKIRTGSIIEDRTGRIWLGSVGGAEDEIGLHIYSVDDGAAPVKLQTFRKKDGLYEEFWLNALLETSDGRIIVGIGNGLSEYVPDATGDEPRFRTLGNYGIVSLAEDVAGNVWIGTNSSGLRRLARGGFFNFSQAENIETKRIGSIITSDNGDVFVLSDSYKIHKFNGKAFSWVRPLEMHPQSWGRGKVTFRDRSGSWWISSGRGLQRYPPVARFEDLERTQPVRTYTTKDGLFADVIFQLLEDSRGDIWIGTIDHLTESLCRWDRATDTIHRYTVAEYGLPAQNPVSALGEDRAGNVWIGFYSGGLSRFTRSTGKFEHFGLSDNLPAGYIANIFTDSVGRVWVATSNGGAVRIDDPSAERPSLTNLTTADGLSSNHVTCTTEDKFGRIYMSTGRGVNRLDLQNRRIKVFTKADGLLDNIVTQCNRDASGALWFGTWEGASRYLPAADDQALPPPVFLSDLRVNGESVRNLSQRGENVVTGLEFASDQRQVQVDFFSLGFGVGESLRYQYKLEGIDSDWSEPSAQRMVNLNLTPGGYTFLVRAVNAEGAVSETPARLSFAIARPVWQRWWFLLVMAVALAVAGYLVYRYRLAQLLKLERVRTRIATDLHDDIGSSLSQIAILSEVARHKSGQNGASEPLQRIADTSRDLVDSMADIVWAINPQKDHLSDLVQRMRRFAGDTFDATEVGYMFRFDEAARDLSLGADLRREIYLVFKECVNNTAKYSRATEVDMSVGVVGDRVVVSVSDNGIGFDVDEALNGEIKGYGGNGLLNMRQRVEKLGGEITIDSEPGRGTTTKFSVPSAGVVRKGREFFSKAQH